MSTKRTFTTRLLSLIVRLEWCRWLAPNKAEGGRHACGSGCVLCGIGLPLLLQRINMRGRVMLGLKHFRIMGVCKTAAA
jgi:hypothetical protein